MPPRLALLLPLLLARPAAGAEPWEVVFEVEAAGHAEGIRLVVEGRWLGEERRLELADHGADPRDRPGDQVWFGVWEGEALRALPVRLEAKLPGQQAQLVYEGTERIEGPADRLSWELVEEAGRLRALRVARPRTGSRGALRSELVQTVAAGIWVLFVLNLAGWLWLGRRREAA